jgi:predicted enzyme related to lactoylglutathione lyase
MSERDSYEPGTPSWVDHSSDDPDAVVPFYRALFGWEAQDMMPPQAPGRYFICRLRGRDVAAIGTQPEAGQPAAWNTYITVADADASAAAAGAAGGTVVSEPFDVFDAGRMAVVQDPAGAVFMLWQPGRHPGAGIVNEPGALTWNELTTRDVEGSLRFYGDLFGWRSNESAFGEGRYVTWHPAGAESLDPSGSIGGMMPMEGEMWPAELPPHWMAYFAVADTDRAAAQAVELGGRAVVAPFDTPAGRMAVLSDPLGGVFSVITLPA